MKHDIECANKSNLLVECFGQNLRNPVLVTQEKAEARDLLESNGLALFLVPEVTSSSLFLFLLTKVLYFCVGIWLLAHLSRDLS